jgi:hypothetical protein
MLQEEFVSIITRRLTFYAEEYEKSANVRLDLELDKALSTMHLYIYIFRMNGKSVYVAFIDFQKAFD